MRKNHFDMMSMMSPKGWLGGSDKSSGKLLLQIIFITLSKQIKTKFMNALPYQMDRLHAINKSGHMFCLRQINRLPAINKSGQNS